MPCGSTDVLQGEDWRTRRKQELKKCQGPLFSDYILTSACHSEEDNVTAQEGGGKGLQTSLGFSKETLPLIPKGS